MIGEFRQGIYKFGERYVGFLEINRGETHVFSLDNYEGYYCVSGSDTGISVLRRPIKKLEIDDILIKGVVSYRDCLDGEYLGGADLLVDVLRSYMHPSRDFVDNYGVED